MQAGPDREREHLNPIRKAEGGGRLERVTQRRVVGAQIDGFGPAITLCRIALGTDDAVAGRSTINDRVAIDCKVVTRPRRSWTPQAKGIVEG
jgi:hypothetical protein